MDYLKIVLDGYLNPSTREHLTDYFFREFKKAEKEYFSPKEFFESGCLQIVEAFKYDIQNKITEEQLKVYKMIEAANSGKFKYYELTDAQMEEPNLVQVAKEKFLKGCNTRLSGLSEKSFSANLFSLTNARYIGNLSWESIEYIEYSILTANKKVLESLLGTAKPTIKKGKGLTIDQIALKLVYEGETVTLENADEIISKFGQNSGKKLYQRFIFYKKRANRIGYPNPKTLKRLKNKIELFEYVIDLLPIDRREMAMDELKILQNLYNNED
jgi:hypothetical protein